MIPSLAFTHLYYNLFYLDLVLTSMAYVNITIHTQGNSGKYISDAF